jgi:hypothetical protein
MRMSGSSGVVAAAAGWKVSGSSMSAAANPRAS